MNREIKFRIWDNYTKHFATCVYENKDCYLCIGRSGYVTAFNCYGEEIDFPEGRFTLQQYTGLKDKNGAEIYEGDLVCCSTEQYSITKPVVFSPFGPGFVFDFFGNYEVVGNIFENIP